MSWSKIHHWFIPHKQTHQKAHLLSWHGILIYILLFILLQVSFSIISFAKPGVLGIASNIDQKRLIELTNQERYKIGLPPLSENSALNQAAQMKAQNMLSENYWAHFAPSGKSPWDFILGAGYKFSYAGENLAKNFYESDAVVTAWMTSPTHKENIINSRYQEIGIAVVNGVLNGEETTLIVQMFGTAKVTTTASTQPEVSIAGQSIPVEKEEYESRPQLVASVQTQKSEVTPKPMIDPYQVSKNTAIAIISLIVILLFVDLWILRKRGVFRFSSHHLAHMAILGVTLATILNSSPGNIL